MGEPVPAALRRLVEADPGPVRPLLPPWRRAATMAPLAVATPLALLLFWGWRSNFEALDVGTAWGLSAVQAVAGLLVVAAALREAVPGRTLSRRALGVTAGGAAALVLGVTLWTAMIVPAPTPQGVWLRFAWECFAVAAVSGLPVLAAAAWLAARALPERPAVTGAVYGLGAGLIADAGVRLFCWVSDPAHVLVAHGGAILGLAASGAIVAALVDRARARAS